MKGKREPLFLNFTCPRPTFPYPTPMSDDSPDDVSPEDFIARMWQFGPKFTEAPPHSRTLGIRFVGVDRARATLALDYNAELVGDPATKVMHGGAITTLLDQTGGFAAVAGFARPVNVATLNLHIDYQRASPPGETVIAVAHAYKVTQHIAFIRGVAHNGDEDDPVATMQASFMKTGDFGMVK